ncbi:ribonuclease activity regulator RraA [Bordetella sp. N]|uniref:ribonuclease activity regulator RraA n=1 Tax=Bordetella sp. N TaxID=1746199 RepID=UPI00070EA60A|nr:ribonuclease activity regulator RraA [Bordetella sp. N]ALM84088.1 dimethylmenaquinone methyltransferase [Bordetella sp. N]
MDIQTTPLPSHIVDTLSQVTTATLTTILFKKGLRNIWIRQTAPLMAGQKRVVGRAFTLRFIPQREDITSPASWSSPISTRAAVEAMPAGCVAIADTAGIVDSGIFGDILCARMHQRGVAGLVTAGAVRDRAGIQVAGLPVWSSGVSAPPAVAQLAFVGWQDPIGCGGVAVMPNDIIVADEDGAIVIPADLLDSVLETALDQEQTEAWILDEVRKGAPLTGLYPMNEENKARYEAYRRQG